jgi:hypothetical protein
MELRIDLTCCKQGFLSMSQLAADEEVVALLGTMTSSDDSIQSVSFEVLALLLLHFSFDKT